MVRIVLFQKLAKDIKQLLPTYKPLCDLLKPCRKLKAVIAILDIGGAFYAQWVQQWKQGS